MDDATRAEVMAHMNADHADAVLLYAQVFGEIEHALSARMVAFDRQRMRLEVDDGTGVQSIDVPFSEPVDSPGAARRVLITMARTARERRGTGDR